MAFGDELPDCTLRSDLVAGDCLREYPNSWDLGTADPVDCGEPHALEIVSVLPLSGLLDERVVWTDVSFPYPDDWSAGATAVYCAVATDVPQLQGSVLDATVTGPE